MGFLCCCFLDSVKLKTYFYIPYLERERKISHYFSFVVIIDTSGTSNKEVHYLHQINNLNDSFTLKSEFGGNSEPFLQSSRGEYQVLHPCS